MDARRRRNAAWASFFLGSLLLGSPLIAQVPCARADSIRPGEEQIDAITVTTRTRASWYGTGFHGKAAANGRPFNQSARTAAHRTLPFGTKVEVINLRNGRRMTVEVTDRGPFVAGRGNDVSAGVASTLGFRDRGVAAVRMSVRVAKSRGLTLVGPSSMYTLWVPPRRGSLSAVPVVLTDTGDDRRLATSPNLAHEEIVAFGDQMTMWQ